MTRIVEREDSGVLADFALRMSHRRRLGRPQRRGFSRRQFRDASNKSAAMRPARSTLSPASVGWNFSAEHYAKSGALSDVVLASAVHELGAGDGYKSATFDQSPVHAERERPCGRHDTCSGYNGSNGGAEPSEGGDH